MRRVIVAAVFALMTLADAARAETVVAGTDGAISYYRSNENAGQRQHRLVDPDGTSGSLPIPSNLGTQFIAGAPFRVEISPEGRLYAYAEAFGTREGRLVIGDVAAGGAHTLATAGGARRSRAGRTSTDGSPGWPSRPTAAAWRSRSPTTRAPSRRTS